MEPDEYHNIFESPDNIDFMSDAIKRENEKLLPSFIKSKNGTEKTIDLNLRLLYGDCLDNLRNLVEENKDKGFVKLICADPPYNSKKLYNLTHEKLHKDKDNASKLLHHTAQQKAFNDAWIWDIESERCYNFILKDSNIPHELSKFVKKEVEYMGKCSMTAYIVYMAPRLLYCHKILRNDGSMYLFCDSTAFIELKQLMNAIFGEKNWINDIVWRYAKMNNVNKSFIRNHDYILYYSKTSNYTFNKMFSDKETSALFDRFEKNISDDYTLRWRNVRYRRQILLDHYVKTAVQKKKGDNIKFKDFATNYEELVKQLNDDDVIIDFKDKLFKSLDDVLYVPILKGNSSEDKDYPTQKPEELLRILIEASSNPGDIVLDPFCGGGTSIIAAQSLGRCWIGIDNSLLAIEKTSDRFNVEYERLLKSCDRIIKIEGVPTDFASMQRLALTDKYDAEYFVITKAGFSLSPGKSRDNMKGPDGGLDGYKWVVADEKDDISKAQQIIASVKCGNNVSIESLRSLSGKVIQTCAKMGVLFIMKEPTSQMINEINKYPLIKLYGKDFHLVEVINIESLFNDKSKKLDIPGVTLHNLDFFKKVITDKQNHTLYKYAEVDESIFA